jgi:hypothetical protein
MLFYKMKHSPGLQKAQEIRHYGVINFRRNPVKKLIFIAVSLMCLASTSFAEGTKKSKSSTYNQNYNRNYDSSYRTEEQRRAMGTTDRRDINSKENRALNTQGGSFPQGETTDSLVSPGATR